MRWIEDSGREPCLLCRKSDWCVRSADGAWAICRRVDTGEGRRRVDKAGGEYWVYRVGGARPAPPIDLPARPSPPCADTAMRDRVYRALLAALPLTPTHRQNLRTRGLNDQEIVRRGYRTLPLQGRASLAKRLVERFGDDVCGEVPGLYVAEQDGRRWWSVAGAVGLLIPVRDLEGHIVALKVRADEAGDGPRYTTISSAKYRGPSPGAQVHVPLHTGSQGEIIRVSEGELKADAATVLSGTLTLSVPGVSCWRAVLPLLEHLQPRQVSLAFDRDWRTKPQVADALTDVAFALMQARYRLLMEDWYDQPEKGIDDLLAAGKRPALKSAALAMSARGRVRAQSRCPFHKSCASIWPPGSAGFQPAPKAGGTPALPGNWQCIYETDI